jgi:hypothetical protein
MKGLWYFELVYFFRILYMYVKGSNSSRLWSSLYSLKFEVLGSCGHVCEPYIVFWVVTPCSLVDRYHLDDWLTVHHIITLVDFQIDAQNSYLFTYNTFIEILYMFRALHRSSSGGRRRNCIYAASGIVTLYKSELSKITVLQFAAWRIMPRATQ